MTLIQWLLFALAIQLIHGLGTWKLYKNAGLAPWIAFVPVYNAVGLMKIINRPWWWTILLFIPVVNLIMFPVVWVETARSFGKNTSTDTALAIFSLGFYNFYLNYGLDLKYIENRDLKARTGFGDWVSSILFAIVAATVVHTYFMQPFTIPTSSLEKTLLVGDFLFVSKFHYGARVPITAVSAPMVHDTVPVLGVKSYSSKFELPYMRLPGFQTIKNNDIVVFNWPVDTLFNMYKKADKKYYKPVDKRTNYVKRCVGIPGDSLEIRNGYVYINGKQNNLPDRAKLQFSYTITFKNISSYQQAIDILKRYDITDGLGQDPNTKEIFIQATEEAVSKAKNHPNIENITMRRAQKGDRDPSIFPNHINYNWNNDFMGPFYIPEAGKTVALDTEVLPLYKRIITEYEGHDLKVIDDTIYIDEQEVNTYTFDKDYYWMMGDNRHNSLDARAWGFVPFDHVVGKPVFIWMSIDSNAKGLDKFRWERFFTTVSGEGEPKSYLIHFLIALGLYWGLSKWRKHKKNNA